MSSDSPDPTNSRDSRRERLHEIIFEADTPAGRAFDVTLIAFVGMPEDGLAYGCLAETLVLAFDGHNHSYSKGVLEPRHVYEIMGKAAVHGFGLGALRLDNEILALERPLGVTSDDNAKEVHNV